MGLVVTWVGCHSTYISSTLWVLFKNIDNKIVIWAEDIFSLAARELM